MYNLDSTSVKNQNDFAKDTRAWFPSQQDPINQMVWVEAKLHHHFDFSVDHNCLFEVLLCQEELTTQTVSVVHSEREQAIVYIGRESDP